MHLALLVFLVAFVGAAPPPQARAAETTLHGTVAAIHDGDTISIRTATETLRVRLYGIDCPEYRQPFSQRARRFTSELTFKKSATVHVEGRDRYDRILGRVVVDGVDVNEALVRAGLAWHYETGTGDRRLAEPEKAARAARAGLWVEKDPIPPWRWRRARGG
jgi:endonuclease YncB( thermonuclease family)